MRHEKSKSAGGDPRPFVYCKRCGSRPLSHGFAVPACPPSCQPIGGHCRGRQSGRFLEIASLLLPLAALRRFPLTQGSQKKPPLCKGRWREAPEGLPLQGRTGCHSQCAHWLRNDRDFGMKKQGTVYKTVPCFLYLFTGGKGPAFRRAWTPHP